PLLTRRDFVSATAAALAASGMARVPARRTRSADGLVVLFQGDSITDAGRDRQVTEPNLARGLGNGYPLLVAAAALAAHPDRALRCGAAGDRWFPASAARRAAARRVAPAAGACFGPLQAGFDDPARDGAGAGAGAPQYWAADGVHPTPAGHAVIAERWRHAAHI